MTLCTATSAHCAAVQAPWDIVVERKQERERGKALEKRRGQRTGECTWSRSADTLVRPPFGGRQETRQETSSERGPSSRVHGAASQAHSAQMQGCRDRQGLFARQECPATPDGRETGGVRTHAWRRV